MGKIAYRMGISPLLVRFVLTAFVISCGWTLLFTAPSFAAGKITAYRPVFEPCQAASGALQLAIRRFQVDGVPHLLLVNPHTLETSVTKADILTAAGSAEARTLANTPFVAALDRYTAPPYKLQNHGASRADRPVDGLFLTVDMCPSKRPFERELFASVADLSARTGGPSPVAVAMSGSWLERHQDDLAWLKGEVAAGKLVITWVNHSSSHPFDPKAPLKRNFLLTPGVDFVREVLATEVLLLENGLTPAPFFRFPGLVADGGLLAKLRKLSLIPIGSDAWLAKGEVPANGSFILVHGNGNEPQGVRKLLPLLRGENHLRLLPLREAFTGGTR
jgi:hypothetical protein